MTNEYNDYYNSVVRKTASGDISAIRSRLTESDRFVDLLHGVLGIASEITELNCAIVENDTTNILEELGDLIWFSFLGVGSTGYEISSSYIRTEHKHQEKPLDYLYEDCSKLLSLVKARIFYGRDIDLFECKFLFDCVISHTFDIGRAFGFSSDDIMEANRIKLLEKRYKKGVFTEEEANCRDTDSELEAVRDVAENRVQK